MVKFLPKAVLRRSQQKQDRLIARAALRGAVFEKIITPRSGFLGTVHWHVIGPDGNLGRFDSRYEAAKNYMDIKDWEEYELERRRLDEEKGIVEVPESRYAKGR